MVDGHVYLLKSDDMLKIGITNADVKIRLNKINKASPQLFESVFYKKMPGIFALTVEKHMLRWLRSRLPSPKQKFDGYTETFIIGDVTFPQIIDKIIKFEQIISKQQEEGTYKC